METEWKKICEEKLEVERNKVHEQQSYQLQQIQLAETNMGTASSFQDENCDEQRKQKLYSRLILH